MSTVTKYYSLQGRVSYFKRQSNGRKGAGVWAQNVPRLDVSMQVDEESIKESHSGNKMKDLVIEIEKGLTTALTLHGFTIDNLARGLWASKYLVEGGTVSAEALPTGLVAGDYFALDHQNTSDWSLVDSTGTPVSLVAGTHYAQVSAFAGHGEILDLEGLTPPVLASYSYANSNALSLLTTRPDDHWLVFDGIETVSKSRCYMEIPRHTARPMSSLSLINNEGVGTMEMEGEALFDGTDPNYPFGKFILAAA